MSLSQFTFSRVLLLISSWEACLWVISKLPRAGLEERFFVEFAGWLRQNIGPKMALGSERALDVYSCPKSFWGEIGWILHEGFYPNTVLLSYPYFPFMNFYINWKKLE
jgi:hypothetical protein